jgi:hypothetical protein
MNALRAVSLLAATVSMGLVAGVFGLYAHTIMPGLGRTDDRTFVGAFQSIDRAIITRGSWVAASSVPWYPPSWPRSRTSARAGCRGSLRRWPCTWSRLSARS